MSFIKDIRRRSRASFRTKSSYQESSQSNGDLSGDSAVESSHSSQKASPSPPSIANDHPIFSASSSKPDLSNGSQHALPQRPVPIATQSNRTSVAGLNNSFTHSGSYRHAVPASPLAPRIESISDNSWVHQKVLLVYGQIGDAYRYSSDGTLTVYHTQDSFPSTTWPVKESHFKALVHLSPGPNKIRFDYVPSKTTQHTVHSSSININYLPLTNSPPLQLAIVLADDSTGKFDAGPEKDIPEGSHLDLAIRKFRMAAYLWQAFTGEQMYRNNFGRRCFRFEEEWQTGTLSSRDTELEIMRNEARVHIIRVKGQIGTMRRHREDFLNDVLSRAIADYFNPQPGQTQHVSALYLDTQWNNERMEIMGNIATGRSEGNVKMAIFNSAALHSYPSCIEEVVPAFTDSFRLDKTCVSSDCGTSWEAASAYIGAHLRETGRLLGCCPRDSGIMSPDYLHFNRTFTTWEPYSVRTSTPGRRCLKEDECGWHRLDVLRFRFHPLFRLPSDAQVPDDSVEVWPVDKDKILVTSGSGVAFVEIFVDGNTSCAGLIEYVNADAGNCAIPRQVTLTAEGVRHQLPPDLKKAKMIKLVIYSGKLRYHVVEDMSQLKTKRCIVKISKNQAAYRGRLVGSVQADGTAPEDLILECATIQTKLLMSIKVYLDGSVADCVTGIEFCYEDSMSQLFGKKSEQPTVQEFTLDTRRGEILMGFFLKFDKFLQGVQILTSLGRKSRVFGKAKGGISHTLIPPRGYSIAGFSGCVETQIKSFSLIITR